MGGAWSNVGFGGGSENSEGSSKVTEGLQAGSLEHILLDLQVQASKNAAERVPVPNMSTTQKAQVTLEYLKSLPRTTYLGNFFATAGGLSYLQSTTGRNAVTQELTNLGIKYLQGIAFSVMTEEIKPVLTKPLLAQSPKSTRASRPTRAVLSEVEEDLSGFRTARGTPIGSPQGRKIVQTESPYTSPAARFFTPSTSPMI